MEIPSNKKTSTKKLTIAAAILGAILISVGIFAYMQSSRLPSASPVNSSESRTPDPTAPATDEQKAAGDAIKKESLDSAQNETPAPSSLNVSITTVQQTGSTVRLRTSIAPLIADGECVLTLTKGSTTVTKTVKTQNSSSYSTCMGFDVANSELSQGDWTATVNVKSGSLTGSANTKVKV